MRVVRGAKIVMLLFVAGATLRAAAPPDVVSGIWHWETDGGDRQINMTLRSDGKKLTGEVSLGNVIVKLNNVRAPGAPKSPLKPEKGSIPFKIEKGKVDGSHFSFLLDLSIEEQTNVPTTFSGDVKGNEMHAVETVVFDKKEIHNIAFTMSRVQNP